ncbi:MAG: DUF2478 domain-containing protein [Polyangiaceae bacterium]|nr:DUF2478 domain-containing protein [Polyangiaceae bacterium]
MTTTPWALISGGRSTGKSGTASRVAAALAARGVRVGGVIQDAVEEGGERVGYVATRVDAPATRLTLARRGAPPEGTRSGAVHTVCSFAFDGDAFAAVRGWLRDGAGRHEVVIVDEVSKLEVSGEGHHAAIEDALGGDALVVLVVRADHLFAVVERYRLEDAVATLDAGDDAGLPAFVDAVAAAVSARSSDAGGGSAGAA